MALLIAVTLALLVIALVAIWNTLVLRRLGTAPNTTDQPSVSILIPARNEAAVIERTLRHLLAQGYPHFEILVLDDHSTDATGTLARAVGGDRVRVQDGASLPAGWLGKNWACHQLAQAAQGDILIFTDADVIWQPGALCALVSEMHHTGADLLTVWPTQTTHTWSERLVVPLMAYAIIGYLPLWLVHHTPWPAFAAANGQCLAFRRGAYQDAHAAVRANIVEDVALARRIKTQGKRLRMADGAGLILCRMYDNWQAVRTGFAKNILAGHGDSLVFLGLSTLFHWALFILPWAWLIVGWPDRWWPLSLIVVGVGVRLLSAAATRQRGWDALIMPVSVLLMTAIAAQSVWWRLRYGGPQWKGRTIARSAHG